MDPPYYVSARHSGPQPLLVSRDVRHSEASAKGEEGDGVVAAHPKVAW